MVKTQNVVQKKNIYFTDMVNNWLLYKKLTVKTSTYYNYNFLINKYLLKKFKSFKMEEFINYNFNETILEFSEYLSAKTIKGIVSIFISILSYTEDRYNIRFHLEPIAMPKQKIKDVEVLSVREQMKLEEFCTNHYDKRYMGIIISLYTGLRIGELCALTWNNIDLRNKRILVNKTLQRIYIHKNRTQILIDSPKSNKSIRKIPMNDKVYEILRNMKSKNDDNEFVLTGDKRYIEPRRYQYAFNKVLKQIGIKDYNFHVLRHTFATNCIKVRNGPKIFK